jgi:hypothetical protein
MHWPTCCTASVTFFNVYYDFTLGCWLCHRDSVRCRKGALKSLLKSRLQALLFDFFLLFVLSGRQSFGAERHASSPVVLPESGCAMQQPPSRSLRYKWRLDQCLAGARLDFVRNSLLKRFPISDTLRSTSHDGIIATASRVGLTPSPTCHTGQGGPRNGDVATSATKRSHECQPSQWRAFK